MQEEAIPLEPFTVAIPEERLQDMRRRLRSVSWPGDFANEDWRFGVREEWLREMVDYWANDYDWRAEEARINSFPNYRVTIDGIPIHFIHVKSARPNAIPLICTHGWPWTFWDWHRVVEELSKGQDGPAFDVVVPSLPGWAFSNPLRTPGLNVRGVARLWVKLMCDVLGYERFAAAGGDWGAGVTAELGHAHPDRVMAIYLNLMLLHEIDPKALVPEAYAPDEQWMVERMRTGPTGGSHMKVHSTDPQTLAYALADSPVGTAAWIWERRRAWADCDGDIVGLMGRDFLCTTASLYWLTNSWATCMRLYANQYGGNIPFEKAFPLLRPGQPSIPVPTGIAVAPKELIYLPRKEVEKRVNLQRWQPLPRGGHFLPSEQPELLAEEFRTFFGGLCG